MSKVSVIIPVYNVEQYLAACLDSVLGQTLQDIEVIAVDDCSQDRSGEILEEYAARDKRVQVIHLDENQRQGFARNRGMERASGQYLYFLDSDDAIEPEALMELSELADRDALDAIFFDSRDVYESEEIKRVYQSPFTLRKGDYSEDVYVGKDLLDDFVRQDEWTCYPQRTFWRREFLANEGIWYPEGSEHEDEFFAFAGILLAQRARYVRKQYFILRIRPNSVMTSKYAPRNFHGYLMNYYHMNRFIEQRGIDTYGSQVTIARMYERVMTLYQVLKDEYDLGEAFVKDLDKAVYSFFASHLRTLEINGAIDQEVMGKIKQHRIVYIYGAKLTAERFCKKLECQSDVLIGGFLVSDYEGVPKILLGRSVRKLDEVEVPDDAIVVAAIKVMFWEETRAMLEKRNITCVFHRKL